MDIEKIEVVAKISKIEAEIVKVHDRQKELDYEKTAIEAEIESLDEEQIRSHVKKHIRDLLKIDLVIKDNDDVNEDSNLTKNNLEEDLTKDLNNTTIDENSTGENKWL